MEAKELRIGNYVQYPNLKRPIKVSIIDTTETVTKTKAQPIPLTEEWLLNFGFEWEDVESKTNGETDKMLFKNILLMKRHQDTLWVACPYGYLISPHRTLYVHQLQNLYFALTGEELTIKNQD
jgi:hypothetical protein